MLNTVAQNDLLEILASLEPAYQDKLFWSYIINFIEGYSYEAQEITISCLIDSFPRLVDEYTMYMNAEI